MNDTQLIQSLVAIGGVSFIAALVQMMKAFIPDGRWYPPLSVAFGLMINLAAAWSLGGMTRASVVTAILSGIMAGLAASGLYSFTQVGKVDEPPVPAVPAKPSPYHT